MISYENFTLERYHPVSQVSACNLRHASSDN
jgi:hypothetical protein